MIQYLRIEVEDTPLGTVFLMKIQQFCNTQKDKDTVHLQIIAGTGQSEDW